MKKYLLVILLSVFVFSSYSSRYTKKHVDRACYDTVSEMRSEKDAKEASLQNHLVDIVEEYTTQACAECYVEYCYAITWYE